MQIVRDLGALHAFQASYGPAGLGRAVAPTLRQDGRSHSPVAGRFPQLASHPLPHLDSPCVLVLLSESRPPSPAGSQRLSAPRSSVLVLHTRLPVLGSLFFPRGCSCDGQ